MLGGLFGFEVEGYAFKLFSVSHVAALIISAGLMVGLYVYRSSIKGSRKSGVKWTLITLLFMSEAFFHMWYFVNGRWDVTINLPLQLCSISLYLCMIMLYTKSYRIFEVAFLVSMSGALIAIITPELFFGLPHLRYFHFFIAHGGIVLSCLYMVWVERYRLTFSSVFRAFAVLNGIALLVYAVNRYVDANYMFLLHKPHHTSLIDFLGPYPWYLLSLEAVSLMLFFLLYMPFHYVQKRG
ncbi:YwaF family protein [Bacillus sp. KH172YL63]|uniref:YwaF family protein n=1 Tax=Bacillus sp. KH172YL63 TaxID=2709784 RepID=UPI0013E4318D|nr:TIGR02206 family membrane protein [Bacillus sp. KH172YL63]BCB03578.1 permease [Bacillus sp. KH172YL63]